jgi:acetyl-CoA carboxylase biotin carboxyl carrier protein
MKGSKKQPAGSDISVPGVDLGQLERLLSFMSEHGLEEFEYAHGDLRIRLKKAIPQSGAAPVLALPAAQAAAPQGIVAQATPATPQTISQPGPGAAQAPSPAAASTDEHIIKSPIVGTFYAGSSPDAGPFVRVGDFVEAGQTVCIIEAMKLMNEIEAECSGTVVEIFAQTGKSVEYGQKLFRIKKA